MEVDLLAVVGDGVSLGAPVSPPGDEVAVLVVAAEEGVEVVVGVGLDGLAAAPVLGGGLRFEIQLAQRGVMEAVGQVAVGVERPWAHGRQDVLARLRQPRGGQLLPQELAGLQVVRNAPGQGPR